MILDSCGCSPRTNNVLLLFHRSSYPDHKDGEDVEVPGERPTEKELDYDDDTMELILPSGSSGIVFVLQHTFCISYSCSLFLQHRSLFLTLLRESNFAFIFGVLSSSFIVSTTK